MSDYNPDAPVMRLASDISRYVSGWFPRTSVLVNVGDHPITLNGRAFCGRNRIVLRQNQSARVWTGKLRGIPDRFFCRRLPRSMKGK